MVRSALKASAAVYSTATQTIDSVSAIYDSGLCARAIRAYLAEDSVPDSLRHARLTARVISIGTREWNALILPDSCTIHDFNHEWHHVGVHVSMCLQ